MSSHSSNWTVSPLRAGLPHHNHLGCADSTTRAGGGQPPLSRRGPAEAPSTVSTGWCHSDGHVSQCIYAGSGSIDISTAAALEYDLGHCV